MQTEQACCWSRGFEDYSEWAGKVVVHGHTTTNDPEKSSNRHNINTGCGMGGYLTAYCVEEDKYWVSSKSPGKGHDWESLRIELVLELKELEEFAELEEIIE